MEKLKGDTNRETIELYLISEDGAVELTDKQKILLQRWEYADELIRMKEIRSRETIALMIQRKFQVSRATAYQDIVNAEGVFCSSTPLNRKYRIGNRIEFIEKKIDELYGRVEGPPDQDEDDQEDPMAKMLRVSQNEEYITQAIALEKVLQKYYAIYPETAPVKSPRTVIYQIQNNVLPSAPMTAEDALRAAGKMIDIPSNDKPPAHDQ